MRPAAQIGIITLPVKAHLFHVRGQIIEEFDLVVLALPIEQLYCLLPRDVLPDKWLVLEVISRIRFSIFSRSSGVKVLS